MLTSRTPRYNAGFLRPPHPHKVCPFPPPHLSRYRSALPPDPPIPRLFTLLRFSEFQTKPNGLCFFFPPIRCCGIAMFHYRSAELHPSSTLIYSIPSPSLCPQEGNSLPGTSIAP
ncbi:hypothetical protein PoB_003927100 [Plakobranchus ocellatus]|uniref:Uncharacterized protein n=1 Tax=Plakobranchus ocellatus TaxID=259542 RepID=A0AAV4B1R6_9GAST|nr:hypothetical protein PoB_003927100 [Plakobranchus ocellatus]